MARRVHVERRAIDAPFTSSHDAASTFVRSLGWRPPPSWTEIDREEAIEVVSSALMNDLVDDAPRMPFREAEERARRFIADCSDEAAFFTNGALEQTRKGFGRHPITDADSDAGVIAVMRTCVSMLWIEDARR